MKQIMWISLLLCCLAVSQLPAGNGVVAYWPFDQDFTNAQGNSDFDGEPSGTAEISAEDVKVGGGSLKIDDDTTTSSHVKALGDFVGPDPVVRTVVGWYKYKDISNDGSDVRNFIWETSPLYSLSFGIRDGSVGKYSQWYFLTATGSALYGNGGTVSDGKWHHAVVIWNSVRDHIKFYEDGQLVETRPVDMAANPVSDQTSFNIGTNRDANGSRNWDGYLDEIAIFDVELSPNQVNALYTDPNNVNPLNVLTLFPEVETVLLYPSDNAKIYLEDIALQWDKLQGGNATYDVYFGTDPNDLKRVAEGISETQYIPDNLQVGPTYYWKVNGTLGLESDMSETYRFELYQNQGLVAYWPFDTDYKNATGNTRYDGVEIDTGNCVGISSDSVKAGAGALKVNDNNPLTHGLIQIPTSPFFAGQKTLTITGWYQYKDIAGDGSTSRPFVFETAPSHTISYGTQFETDGMDMGEWYLRGRPGASDTSGPIDSDPNGWHHVALVYDAIGGSMSFYYDGQRRDYVEGTPYAAVGDGLEYHEVLNFGDYRGADGERMFDGYIDEMAAFDVALTARQVQGLFEGEYNGQPIDPTNVLDTINDVYAKNLYPNEDKIVPGANLAWTAPQDINEPVYRIYFGIDPNTFTDTVFATTSETQYPVELDYGQHYYWKVDVIDGTTIYSGNRVSFSTALGLMAWYPFDTDFANAQGDALYDGRAIGNVVASPEDYKVGSGALKIDDNTSSANLVTIEPSPFIDGQQQLTITGWFKYKDISGNGSDSRPFILESDDYDISYGTRFEGEMLDGGEWYFHGSPAYNDTSGPMITANDPWHHFALVYNADTGIMEFYFDGAVKNHVESTPGSGLAPTQYINIGDYRSGNGGRNFDGYIDDIAFFDIALSGSQIKALALAPEQFNGGNIMDAVLLEGDINYDLAVTVQDLADLAAAWMTDSTQEDLNLDGTVNNKDLSILSSNWLVNGQE